VATGPVPGELEGDAISAPNAGGMRNKTFVSVDGATISIQDGSPPKHLHANANEIQYILEGKGTIWLGDKEVQVKPGDLVTSLPIALTPGGMEPVGAYSNVYNGAYADRMRLTAAMCMKIPNGLDHRRAALTEPMAVGRHAVARVAITPAEAAVVLGAGPVGLAVVAELRRLGVETIVVSDFSPRRRAVALAAAAHGAELVLIGRTVSKLEAVHAQIAALNQAPASIAPLDLEQALARDYDALADALQQRYGRLDGLLHNAGILGVLAPIEHYDVATWCRVLHVNLTAAFALTQVLLPLLRNSKDGSIVFTSSGAGRQANAYWGAYAVSKFGIEALSRVLAKSP